MASFILKTWLSFLIGARTLLIRMTGWLKEIQGWNAWNSGRPSIGRAELIQVFFSQDTMVLGGTHQSDNWSTQPDPKDSEFIWSGCHKLLPELEGVELIRVKTLFRFVSHRPQTRRIQRAPVVFLRMQFTFCGSSGSKNTFFLNSCMWSFLCHMLHG